jgi:citrate synthase
MAMGAWMSMDEACGLLGVRPQTIYAYVSRGKLEVMTDPADTRRSLYRAEDVAGLARRKQAGRKHETVATNTLFGAEPSIPTALCAFFKGRPYYRGRDVVALARTASLEDAARLLWDTREAVDFSSARPARSRRVLQAPPGRPGRAAPRRPGAARPSRRWPAWRRSGIPRAAG